MEDKHDNLPKADGSTENQENQESAAPQEQETSTPTATEKALVEEKETAPVVDENVVVSEEQVATEAPKEEASAEAQTEEPAKHLSDDELEAEDTHEDAVESDDDHEEEHHEEEEIPDYEHYAVDQLLAAAEKVLKELPIQKVKNHIDPIRKNLLKQLNDERQEKLEEFLEQGGVEMDFEYIQPSREKFRKLYGEYKSRRRKYYDDLNEQLQNNLKIKNELIEKIKEIVTKDESLGDTFKEFNEIQQEWRNTGPVPRTDSADLWRTYHHHVENFYEYVKINKELRDLDFKKNREAKEALIAKADSLSAIENVGEAFRELQGLHKKWKETGPVERENREPMWERFSEATKKIHDRREEFQKELNEKREELIAKKKEILEKLNARPKKHDTHRKWQDAIKEVEAIREEFRKIGRINHPENDLLWDAFREEMRAFNKAKNGFYKTLKQEHHDNLEKKRSLIAIAEELKDSEDWSHATNEMKRIQAEWKRIGHVPKSESDKIWKQFRAACNHYFDRLSDKNKARDKEFEVNLDAKKQIIEELKAWTPSENRQEAVQHLKDTIQKWKEAGKVPRNAMNIDKDFNKVLDDKFKAIDMDRKEAQRIRFENRMENLSGQGGERMLARERDQVRRKIDEANKELMQLENNMGFFSNAGSNNPLLKEAEKNIQQQKNQIEALKEQMKMLNVKIREMKQAQEEGAESDESSNDE